MALQAVVACLVGAWSVIPGHALSLSSGSLYLNRRRALGTVGGLVGLTVRSADAAPPSFKEVKGHAFGPKEAGVDFSLELPESFFVSVGARGRNGVVLSAVNTVSGQAISVVEASAPELLRAQSFLTTGPYDGIEDIGSPKLLAYLLTRQRDGDLKTERRGASSVVAAQASGLIMDFETSTITSQGVSGSAGYNPCMTASDRSSTESVQGALGLSRVADKTCDEKETERLITEAARANSAEKTRTSRGRAVLLPARWRGGEGRLVVLWASNAGAWDDGAGSEALDRALESFRVDIPDASWSSPFLRQGTAAADAQAELQAAIEP